MTENGTADQQQPTPVQMKILGQFIRDLSFENVVAQKGGANDAQPNISVQVNMDAKKRPTDKQYEVLVKLKIEAKAKESDEQLFLLELEYVGVFLIDGVQEDQLHPFLLIECPRMLFPFLRRIVSDITRDGGFPPLNLDNIDFMKIYRDEITRRQAAMTEQKHDA
ncbi:MAG: protein-export chaperone SecB [Rhodobacteraceae bacterium]|nr:protein-export chaperone SecB [Paracoccaceae bacterium]